MWGDDDDDNPEWGWISAIPLVLVVIFFAIWWMHYKYEDCLRVGHTKTYCVLDIGH